MANSYFKVSGCMIHELYPFDTDDEMSVKRAWSRADEARERHDAHRPVDINGRKEPPARVTAWRRPNFYGPWNNLMKVYEAPFEPVASRLFN
jgi:hypothetical protein